MVVEIKPDVTGAECNSTGEAAPEETGIADRCKELAGLMTQHTDSKANSIYPTAIQQLSFARFNAVSTPAPDIYQPILVIVVQGQKAVLLGEETYQYGAGQYLVVSVDLPVSGFVTEAAADKPYLALILNLDLMQLSEMVAQINPCSSQKENPVRGLFVSSLNAALIDCATRLVKLLDTPRDIFILAPMIIREIHYRLLTGTQCETVRQIATLGGGMQRVAEAIELIKADFTSPMRIEDLAGRVNMSASSFHQHFKQVTSMSPIQYQKQLRLLAARRLMLAEDSDATNAAYQVGYESPSQFNREYARLFGAPPIRDIERLRTA